MNKRLEHLYIHIPFCKNICAYCDFVRQVKEDKLANAYLARVVKEIDKVPYGLKTVYIGGGTPNCLDNKQLSILLKHVHAKLLKSNYEFTIEFNPELVTLEQCQIMKLYGVNRASIGVQTTNDSILRKFNRHHTLNDVKRAISNLKKVQITNINLDFMYGFNELTNKDIKCTFNFIKTSNIKHVSWYALEIKDNSAIAENKYQLDDDQIESHLKMILNEMKCIGFNRYEVSSWSKNKNYQSQHNKAYWLSKDWMAIGLGGFGLQNETYYQNIGSVSNWKKLEEKYDNHNYYLHILLMGLRLTNGLDLKNNLYKKAYLHFKNKLKFTHIKNHHLIADNLNLLNETLIGLV